MIASRLVGVRIGSWTLVCVMLLGLPAGQAADCPGHADAIGTSRTLAVDPREHPRVGSMQYPETLPLRDHEVVLPSTMARCRAIATRYSRSLPTIA